MGAWRNAGCEPGCQGGCRGKKPDRRGGLPDYTVERQAELLVKLVREAPAVDQDGALFGVPLTVNEIDIVRMIQRRRG